MHFNRHTTFFEMLGNWSLGDYFKRDQLSWIWEFFTQVLKIPQQKLYVTVFEGNQQVKKDQESIKIWQNLGVKEDHISEYSAEKNWWSRAGEPANMPPGEIGGTTSEIFFKFESVKHNEKFGKKCHTNCECGRFLEIGNSVFMEYEKQKDGGLKSLPKQNVDFGGGLERLVAAVKNTSDIFQIDVLWPIVEITQKISGKEYKDNKKAMRIIADHSRAAVFMIAEGVKPSNKIQGYILRRLLRRVAVEMHNLIGGIRSIDEFMNVYMQVVNIYSKTHLKNVEKLKSLLHEVIAMETGKFALTINRGVNGTRKKLTRYHQEEVKKYIENNHIYKSSWLPLGKKAAEIAFDLYQTNGVPIDIFLEEFEREFTTLVYPKSYQQDIHKEFEKLRKQHADQSRSASAGMFKGGLADKSEDTIKLHTASHLLHSALRKVLGEHVQQTGSNITSERLRFDFKHPEKLTPSQIKKVETLINEKIKNDLPVKKTIETKDQALKSGALAFFRETYPDKVSVYTIGDFSKELCGGPHVSSTGEIGAVRIKKQESIGGGIRRLYAALWN